ncbi:MAG TPA: hypothetical protein VFB81_15175, partial [Myxococcales bacterium]|nr:hypothetical protein [Myxococcales bacterium]
MSFADRMQVSPAFAICFLAFHLALALMGYGAALLLLPWVLKRDALIFAPVFGFCVLGFSGWHLMFVGPPGTDRYWPWMLLIGAGLTAAGCAVHRRILRQTLHRDVAWLSLFAAIGACFLASPMTRQPHLTSISQFNNDVAHYAAIERLLQERKGDTHAGPDDPFSLIPTARAAVTSVYLGTAAQSSAMGVHVYQLQQTNIAVYLFWGAMLAGLFALRVLHFSRPGAMLVTLIAGLGNSTLFTAWNGYKSQLAAMALLMALFTVVLPALEGENDEPPGSRLPAAIALGLGLSLTYQHMLPLVWGVLGVVGMAHVLRRRSWGHLGRVALVLGGALLVMVAVSPGRAQIVVDYFQQMATLKEVGWFLPWMTPLTFLGLSGEGLFQVGPRGWAEVVLPALGFAGLLFWGFRRTLARDRPVAVSAAAILATVLGGYLVLCITGKTNGVLGGYKSYKLVTFFYPALLACALLAFRELTLRSRTWRERVWLGAAVALGVGVVLASAASVRGMRGTPYVVRPEMVALEEVERDPRVESLNLTAPEWWEQMWQTAFLVNKRLYHQHATYYPKRGLEGQWTVEKTQALEPAVTEDVLWQAPADPAEIIPVNARYR